jgi:hypothetical protein
MELVWDGFGFEVGCGNAFAWGALRRVRRDVMIATIVAVSLLKLNASTNQF